ALTRANPSGSGKAPPSGRTATSGGEGRAAPAGARGLRVLELEPRPVQTGHVVDDGTVEILARCRIDHDPHVLEGEDCVVALRIVEAHGVREPGAPAANDAETKRLLGPRALFLHGRAHLLDGLLGEDDR